MRKHTIANARVQALPAISHLIHARKSVENGSVLSLSFGTFLSLYLATKEKEKYIKLLVRQTTTPYISKKKKFKSPLKQKNDFSKSSTSNRGFLFYTFMNFCKNAV